MKNFICYIGSLISIIIISSVFILCFRESSEAVRFLESYGWEVEDSPIETVEIKIPDIFDDVYENYNLLQIDAGLDLNPYKGKNAVRYTFRVKNYPENVYGEVRGNVIIVDGKPIAGDISTVAIDGFMHSLKMNSAACMNSDISIY